MKRSYLILAAAAAAIVVVLMLRRQAAGGQQQPFFGGPPTPTNPPPGTGPSGFLAGILSLGCQGYAASNGAPPGMTSGACGQAADIGSKYLGVVAHGYEAVGKGAISGVKKVGSAVSSVFHSLF